MYLDVSKNIYDYNNNEKAYPADHTCITPNKFFDYRNVCLHGFLGLNSSLSIFFQSKPFV